MVTYSVYREWGGEENWASRKYFTTEQLQVLSEVYDAKDSELADIVTGLNCDSYADMCCEVIAEYMELEGDIDSVVYMLCDKHLSEAFDTCLAWYRCLNMQLSDSEVDTHWRENVVTECEAYLEREA